MFRRLRVRRSDGAAIDSGNPCAHFPVGIEGTLLVLEPRIMFDGAAVATGAEVAADQIAQEQAETTVNSDAEMQATSQDVEEQATLLDALATYVLPTESERREIVFIDTSVQGYQTLIAGIDSSAEVILLDANRDGVEQIAEVMAQRTGIDAAHIVSHGSPAELRLGTARLTLDSMNGEYTDELAIIGQAFTDGADFLIYGCNFGLGKLGQDAVSRLAELTGADVAASVDDTGSAQYSGDWELEYHTGRLETSVVLSVEAQQNWDGKLAVITVDTTNDLVDGDTSSVSALLANKGADGFISLREAIIAVNADAGGDTINLAAGTYTLSIGGTGENAAATGDLDILKNVTISGAGSSSTIIDANRIDRVFDVRAGMTTISGVTIMGGSEALGAGIDTQGATTLNLFETRMRNNDSSNNGGAIFNRGTLNLERVAIGSNTATNLGGGIYFSTGSDGTLTNVTISGNSAANGGGFFNASSTVSIFNSTLASNSTGIGTAGGHITELKNSILDNVGTNADSALTSLGFNIDSDGTALLGDPLDGIDPMLGVLAENGGPTRTHALLVGSPAIDAGTVTGAPAVDQRGVVRDANVDIGAFEATQLVGKSEFLVNTYTTDQQVTDWSSRGSHEAVAMAPTGNYVVVWSSENQDGNGWGIYGQRFAKNGNPIGNEFLVTVETSDNQQFASVAIDNNQNFVVVWTSHNQDDGSPNNGVFARVFDWNLTPTTPNDIQVNTTSNGDQAKPSVAIDPDDGNFVVVWEGNGEEPGETDAQGVFFRRFDATGTALDPTEKLVDEDPSNAQNDAAVAMNANGDFVVVFDDSDGLHFRLFDNTGAPVLQDIVDGSVSAGEGSVAMHDDGSFVVAWRETVFGRAIFARRYDATGTPIDLSGFLVNASVLGDQTDPSISIDAAGNFIVVWEGNGDQAGNIDSAGVFGQKYDSSGNPVGSEFLINQTTSGAQTKVSVAMLNLDNFVAVWSGEGPGDTDGVYARQFGTAFNVAPTLDLDVDNSSMAAGNDFQFTFTEEDGPTAVADSDTDVADIDSIAFDHVTLSFSGLLDGNAETLLLDGDTFALATAVAGQDTSGNNYHMMLTAGAGTATVTITKRGGGTFTEGEAETLITAIEYQHTDTSTPTDGDRLLDVTVNDGAADSVAARTTINLNPVNDQPSFSGLDNSPTFTEGGAAVVLDNNATIADPELDAANSYNGATLTLVRNGGANAEDQFDGSGSLSSLVESSNLVVGATTIGTVTANSGGTLVLTFNSNATTALVNNALQQITYANSSATPPASVQIDFTFDDSNAGGQGIGGPLNDTGSITVNINATNTAPMLDLDADGSSTQSGADYATTFTEAGGPVGIADADANVSDVDSATLTSLTVTITNLLDGTSEVLAANTSGTSIMASYNAGVLTLSGADTVANYQQVLRTITYDNSATNPNTTARAISFVANDGTDPSNVGTTTVTMNGINSNPVITSNGSGATANVSVQENQTSVTTVTVTDADVPPDTLTFSIAGGADQARFSIDGNTGVLTFKTAPDFEAPVDANLDGVYEVNVQVDDGNNGTDMQAISVTVNDNNDAPVITSDGSGATANLNAAEDQTSVTTVTATDQDIPASMLTYSISGGADASLFSIDSTTGVLTFNAAPDFAAPTDANTDGVFEVTVQVDDGQGGSDAQAISVTVIGSPIFVPPPSADSDSTSESDSESENDVDTDTSSEGDSDPAGKGSIGNVTSVSDSPQGDSSGGNHGSLKTMSMQSGRAEDTLQMLSARHELMDGGSVIGSLSELIDVLRQPFEPTMWTNEIQFLLTKQEFLHDLDRVRDAFNEVAETEKINVASSIAASTGLSIGYVIWLVRSGVLLSTLLSTLPAWQFVNPVQVLATPVKKKRKQNEGQRGDDSLESMVEDTDSSEAKIGPEHKGRQSRWSRRLKR